MPGKPMSISSRSGVAPSTNCSAASASPTLCATMSSSSSSIVRLAAASALSSTIRTCTRRILLAGTCTGPAGCSPMEHAHARDMAIVDTELTGVNASIEVSSGAFGYNEPIPAQYTADGEGVSPPLEWRCVPLNAEAVVVVVEDADSPTSLPVVHSIMWDLPGTDASLPEGALQDKRCSANDGLAATRLPPDPPPGIGVPAYVLPAFGLDAVPRFEARRGRAELLNEIKGRVIAQGLLSRPYERH